MADPKPAYQVSRASWIGLAVIVGALVLVVVAARVLVPGTGSGGPLRFNWMQLMVWGCQLVVGYLFLHATRSWMRAFGVLSVVLALGLSVLLGSPLVSAARTERPIATVPVGESLYGSRTLRTGDLTHNRAGASTITRDADGRVLRVVPSADAWVSGDGRWAFVPVAKDGQLVPAPGDRVRAVGLDGQPGAEVPGRPIAGAGDVVAFVECRDAAPQVPDCDLVGRDLQWSELWRRPARTSRWVWGGAAAFSADSPLPTHAAYGSWDAPRQWSVVDVARGDARAVEADDIGLEGTHVLERRGLDVVLDGRRLPALEYGQVRVSLLGGRVYANDRDARFVERGGAWAEVPLERDTMVAGRHQVAVRGRDVTILDVDTGRSRTVQVDAERDLSTSDVSVGDGVVVVGYSPRDAAPFVLDISDRALVLDTGTGTTRTYLSGGTNVLALTGGRALVSGFDADQALLVGRR